MGIHFFHPVDICLLGLNGKVPPALIIEAGEDGEFKAGFVCSFNVLEALLFPNLPFAADRIQLLSGKAVGVWLLLLAICRISENKKKVRETRRCECFRRETYGEEAR